MAALPLSGPFVATSSRTTAVDPLIVEVIPTSRRVAAGLLFAVPAAPAVEGLLGLAATPYLALMALTAPALSMRP